MRHYRALAKHFVFATTAALALALGAGRSGAQVTFDGLDWTTDRGNVIFDAATNLNAHPTRQGFNGGPNGIVTGQPLAPNVNLDSHRAVVRWTFPYNLDLQGATAVILNPATKLPSTVPPTTSTDPALGGSPSAPRETLIIDNPYRNFDKSDITIFNNSTQPLTVNGVGPSNFGDARNLWLPNQNAFVIPPTAQRSPYSGFSFSFIPSDATIMPDPFAGNPGTDAEGDYGYVFATHNDFPISRSPRGGGVTSPITGAEVAQFPNAAPNVYSAVNAVLTREYNNAFTGVAGSRAVAQWIIGNRLNNNFTTFTPVTPATTPPTFISTPGGLVAADPDTATFIKQPNQRSVKYTVDIFSAGSGTQIADGPANSLVAHPNVLNAFARVSWRKTLNADGSINRGTETAPGSGVYVSGAGGINDPANSRIYVVDMSQPGFRPLGAAGAAPASFPEGGRNSDGTYDEIAVTLFTITPDLLTDTNVYAYPPLVTADACRFTQQDIPGTPDPTIIANPDPTVQLPSTPLGPLHNSGPKGNARNPNNKDTEFIAQIGRFLGPMAGVRTTDLKLPHPQYIALDNVQALKNPALGSTLWYCVREEIINNQARVLTDPTLPFDANTNPYIIDPATSSVAPVFYCLTNEDNIVNFRDGTTANPLDTYAPSKLRVRWRYVGFPDGGSATSFTSPVISNVRGRDGQYHTIVYFCSSSNTATGGDAGRVYALDALGDPADILDATGKAVRTTQTTAYWTYPSLRPRDAAAVAANLPNEIYDPNYTGSTPDPNALYPVSGSGGANTPRTVSSGIWWNPDQNLGFAQGEYYDGDIINNNNPRLGGKVVKTDTRITMGGITGAPVVMNDPSNLTGPMILVVPSLDGHLYAFDAAGRGDFDDTKPLPALPPDNNNLPASTIYALGVNLAVPGTTQRMWTWPHYSADAYRRIISLKDTQNNLKNTFLDEEGVGSMPYSPAYDPTYAPYNSSVFASLLVSAGTPGEDGLPGSGHVYGILPLRDSGFTVGSNNIPVWKVTGTAVVGNQTISVITDRRYFAYPRVGTRVNDPGDTPLLDIPGVPTIFAPTNNPGARDLYFTSQGRVYSVNFPNANANNVLPGPGNQSLNWVYPPTPVNYVPYPNPNDPATTELPQGLTAKGVAVIPGSITGAMDVNGAQVDLCYALLTDGTLIALEANPTTANRPAAFQTNLYSQGRSGTGTFTESAPILIEATIDPNFGGVAPTVITQNILPPPSVPALLFADDNGRLFALKAVSQTYPDGAGGTVTKLPVVYQSSVNAIQDNNQIVTPPALVGSSLQTPPPAQATDTRTKLLLAAQPNQGGYFAVGDADGRMIVFGVGRFANGFGETEGGETVTANGAGNVSIDIRNLNAYTDYSNPPAGFGTREYDKMAPTRGQALGSGYTPAHKESAAGGNSGANYTNTAHLAPGLVPDASNDGIAVDQGGTLYFAASGVYHAQTPDTTQPFYGTTPIITVVFHVSQNGTTINLPPMRLEQVTPLSQTNSPGKGLTGANGLWPDDRAIALADKDNLSIFGVDENDMNSTAANPTGLDYPPQNLKGTVNNVFPWVAKFKLPIIPGVQGGVSTYAPLSSGYTVSVTATIEQNIFKKGGRSRRANAHDDASLGKRNDAGLSQSQFTIDPNNPSLTGAERYAYITNPLALTTRGLPNNNFRQDLTGTPLELVGSANEKPNPISQNRAENNIIGWAGPVDNATSTAGGSATPVDIREVLGNGAYVGLGSGLPGDPSVKPAKLSNRGYIKPVFAPFDMTQDNATVTYTAKDVNGVRKPAIFIMDRTDLKRVTGHPIRVRTRFNSLNWNGSVRSVMNPLPFEQLPDNTKPTVDYPALDSRRAHLLVNGTDAGTSPATLVPPTDATSTNGEVDPSTRIPQPTPVSMSLDVPRFQPANVNRGMTAFGFRGTTIYTGGPFVDQGGFVRGYNSAIATNFGYNQAPGAIPTGVPQYLAGPLDTQLGLPPGQLTQGTPSGGYIGSVSVLLASGAGTNTQRPLISRTTTNFVPPTNAGQVSRVFQTGISVAPSARMRVLESVLDMGNAPGGTGYSDVNATGYRFPFAPSATGPYETLPSMNNQFGQVNYSPWDTDGQLSAGTAIGLPTLNSGTTIPQFGRFFRPFTLVSDSNYNLTNLRMSKLIGAHYTDPGANPNLAGNGQYPGVIKNESLSVNPPSDIARSTKLNSDTVNGLLSPPLLAVSFGQGAPGVGNIGVVTSFDHSSYANSVLSETNLYPLINPAVTGDVNTNGSPVQQALDLYNMGLTRAQWNQSTQPYPTLHKPRTGDGVGTVATIPDQPHDYQTSTLNNNQTQNGQPSYYQQLTNAGLFGRPAMAVAVPMGTPVGTYVAPLYPFEDGLPIQWQEWLAASDPTGNANSLAQTQYLGNNDDILNTNAAGAPVEPYANPGTAIKVTVRESRLTEGATSGVLPQIDLPRKIGNTNYLAYTDSEFYDPLGINLQPAALMIPYNQNGNIYSNRLMLFWTTNRQQSAAGSGQSNGKFVDSTAGLPTAVSPLSIGYSGLDLPYVYQKNYIVRPDARFSGTAGADNSPGNNNKGNLLPGWWGISGKAAPDFDSGNNSAAYGLLPGFDGSGLPSNYVTMFDPAPINPVVVNAATVQYASPATTLGTDYDVNTGSVNYLSTEAYLVYQGSADVAGTSAVGLAPQRTRSRTFITSLNNFTGNSSALGYPENITSFDNDPNVPKLSPHPLLARLHNVTLSNGSTQDMKFLYIFYHSGSQGRTSLYYNVNSATGNINGQFPAAGFQTLGDQKLPTPGALTWQSDPYPVYRRVVNPLTGNLVDAVEVMYTGVLKNRQTVEILLSRYRIVEEPEVASLNGDTPALKVGQLVPMPFPTVHQETLTRVTGTNTYAARDAGWFVPGASLVSDTTVKNANAAGPNAVDPTVNRFMRLYVQASKGTSLYLLNGLANNNVATRGRIDPASGLVYFNGVATELLNGVVATDAANRPLYSGGQVVVDPRSGTISFPNIAPGKNAAVLASYTPYVMRLNTSRDETNAERDPSAIGITDTNTMSYPTLALSHPGTASSGQNYGPTYVMDRAPNSRALLQSPQVLFNPNGVPAIQMKTNGQPADGSVFPPIDRMWTLYRKTDPSSKTGSAIYMKSLRLTARLPFPVALSAPAGTATSPTASQAIGNLTVTRFNPTTGAFDQKLRAGYEVDWVRGRVYFREEDEGDLVQISYGYFNPKNPTAPIQSGSLTYRVAWSDEISASGTYTGDITTPEVAMPITTTINEGQVSAFKDPFVDKLWVFWSSTRSATKWRADANNEVTPINNSNVPLGQTDLFFQTIAPQFYPTASNQY